jgi:nucleotide-binding universal stress UspA family protein
MEPSSRNIVIAIESVTQEGFKSNPVVHWALRNSVRKGDTLIFIHATKHLDAQTAKTAGYTSHTDLSDLERNISGTAMDVLRAYGDELASIAVHVKIVNGDPRQVLVKAVEEHAADIVIIGSRGVGAVKR